MIQQCEFRADLYWRLAVLSIEASPLSTRRQDIPAMIGLFLRQASELISARSYTPPFHVQDAALEVLCNADYPGNIRTLRNLIYTLASRVSDQEPISLELVQSLIAALMKDKEDSDTTNCNRKLATEISKSRLDADLRIDKSAAGESPVSSYISDGDIMLPLEVRILRRGETFRQWTARAKKLQHRSCPPHNWWNYESGSRTPWSYAWQSQEPPSPCKTRAKRTFVRFQERIQLLKNTRAPLKIAAYNVTGMLRSS